MGTDFESFLGEQLKDPEFKTEYDALESEFSDIQAQIDCLLETEQSLLLEIARRTI